MRIYLKLSKNLESVPFNYQERLVRKFHQWIGRNNLHDAISLYSMSQLSSGKLLDNKALTFENGAVWFISSPSERLIKQILQGIQKSPEIGFGMYVSEAIIKETPVFPEVAHFNIATPVLVKRTIDRRVVQYGFRDEGVDELLTETLKHKLEKANIVQSDVAVSFAKNHPNAKQRLVTYKGIKNKANVCPITIKGPAEAIAFAWDVGVGNSTGIGFGALI